MNFEERFIRLWNSVSDLEILDETEDTICKYALCFQDWVNKLLKVFENADIVGINQAKILLTDKFYEWRREVPLQHRKRLGIHGHTCIFQVFKAAYEKIRFEELKLMPPLLYLPEKKPPPEKPIYHLAGIHMGELGNNDEE